VAVALMIQQKNTCALERVVEEFTTIEKQTKMDQASDQLGVVIHHGIGTSYFCLYHKFKAETTA